MYYFIRETNSDDSNPGTFEQPFKTITKGIQVSGPGDVVYVRQGIYREAINFYHGGLVDAHFKLAGYPGERPIIDLHGYTGQYTNGINSNEHDYIAIENFLIMNALQFGIIVKNCTWLEIKNIKTYNTKWAGVAVRYSKDVRLINSEVELACNVSPSAFVVLKDVDDFEISDNFLHSGPRADIGNIGFNVFGDCSLGRIYQNRTNRLADSGVYLDAGSGTIEDIDIFLNKIQNGLRHGMVFGSEQGGTLKNINAYNNTIFGCGWSGMRIAAHPEQYEHPMENIELSRNLIFVNGWNEPSESRGGILHNNSDATDVKIIHNVVSQNKLFQIVLRDEAEAVVDDNLIDGFRGADGEILGTNPTEGDEQFLMLLMNQLRER